MASSKEITNNQADDSRLFIGIGLEIQYQITDILK